MAVSNGGGVDPRKNVPGGRLVALATAAEELSVSVKTIRRRIADGTVRAYRIGRLIRVDLDELRAAVLVVVSSSR